MARKQPLTPARPGPVLQPIARAEAGWFEVTRQMVGELSFGTHECSRRLLKQQLAAGLAWDYAKYAPSPQPATKALETAKEVYASMKLRNPALVARRTLDQWGLGVLLACATKGLVRLELPHGNEKMPKPESAQLLEITWQHLEAIAGEFGTMAALLRELRPSGNQSAHSLLQRLTQTVRAIESADDIAPDCLAVMETLASLIARTLEAALVIHARSNSAKQSLLHESVH